MSSNQKQMTINFEAYGVCVSLNFQKPFEYENVLSCIKNAIPTNLKILQSIEKNEHIFKINAETKSKYSLKKNSEPKITSDDKSQILERLESLLRLTVAEHADAKVFIHAGVVELGGRAVIIPARSFKGKTTLVVELIKAGAKYYSDEYAVVDENGLIYAFPKTLSVRGIINDYTQVERPYDFYGASLGLKPIKAGMILVTEYQKGTHWKPRILSQGEAVLELISNTIPIRNKPEYTLFVLNKLAENALAVKSKRGEAKRFAKNLIRFFETEMK